ncbi:site-2 protease family protein [Marinomonas algicola]|uniref:site-2 protease family protein n=1 Tax=Marinomonas algicola TaxID=2773454 RepID=UPI0017487600|nr:site-2 protease family protein [Marinomonas algicola]
MQLLRIECLGKELRLEAAMSGWQGLFWDGHLVSQINASADALPLQRHSFTLQSSQGTIECHLDVDLEWQPFLLQYTLTVNETPISEGQITTKDIEKQEVIDRPPEKTKFSFIGLGSFALKMLKSAKAIKVLFAAGSLAAYSWLFSIEFALALIACLVFHEYGHIRAMKYFGMKTKGIYLIPFIGGLALSESKINTRWQDVVIAIMGPFFGLLLSIISLIIYWVTDIELFAGIASFNALLNLFNLLPVLPLDGGHILKSVAFSMNSVFGLIVCVLGALLGIAACYYFGFALLGFILFIGTFEILFEWRDRHRSQLLPLDRYGQTVSALWYVVTVGLLCSIIYILGTTGNNALAIPMTILGA